jgi:hypothetical protein
MVVIIVADGAGAAPRAEVGSELASSSALDYVVASVESAEPSDYEFDWTALVRGAIGSAIESIQVEAAAQCVPMDYYATTLTIVIAMPKLVIAAQVGDGMVFVAGQDGGIVRLTVPQRGEYSNETNMLTSANARDTIQITFWRDPVTGIAVMSDGLLPITTVLPYYKPYFPFFTNLFAFLRHSDDHEQATGKLKSFLMSDRVQDGTGDDLTLVLSVSTESPIS